MLAMRSAWIQTLKTAEHLTAVSAHLFEDTTTTYHPFGFAGEIAGLSSNALWASRQLL